MPLEEARGAGHALSKTLNQEQKQIRDRLYVEIEQRFRHLKGMNRPTKFEFLSLVEYNIRNAGNDPSIGERIDKLCEIGYDDAISQDLKVKFYLYADLLAVMKK